MTVVVESARLELLQTLAVFEWYRRKVEAEAAHDAAAGVIDIATGHPPVPGVYPMAVPLVAGEWEHTLADIGLAAKEAAALGHIIYENHAAQITKSGVRWLHEAGRLPLTPEGHQMLSEEVSGA